MDKSLFKRATEDTPDATPGYMFRDIAQWTFVDQNTQSKLVAALFDKLTPKNSVHVLAKVLRIMKIVCETGHADFQKEIQRRSDQIKDYASYRGVPHPQFGDRLNEKVRIAAKDAIEAAFTSRKENKIQVEAGHGSEPSKASSSASGVVGGVFNSLGFSSFTTGHQISASQAGDTRVAAMPTTNKWAEQMARSGAEPSASMAAVSSVVDKAKLGFGLFGNEQIKTKEDRMWSAQSEVGEFKAVDIAFVGGSRGPFGPNATTFADSSSSSSAAHGASGRGGGGGATGWKFGSEAEAGLPPIEQHATLGGRFLTPYQREVERIATMKNTPQRVDLTQFLAAVKDIHDNQGMSYEDLAQTLDEYIGQKHPWQARLNVMTLIEALVKAELTSEIGDYFNENPEDVQRNVHVVQSSLKEKSQKVLKLLGIPEKTSVLPQQHQGHTSAAHHADNNTLQGNLDFDSMTVTRKPKRAAGKSGGNEMTTMGGDYEDPSQARGGSSERTFSTPTMTNNNNNSRLNLDDTIGKISNYQSSSSDPTKLRRRAQMNTEALEASPTTSNTNNNNNNNSTAAVSSSLSSGWGAPAATTTASTDAGGWGNAGASGGWGAVGASSSPAGGDGWGTPTPPAASPIINTNNNNNGSPTMMGGEGGWGANGVSQQMPPSQQQQQQLQQSRAKQAVDFDELFSSSSPSSSHSPSHQQQTAARTLPAPTVTASGAVLTPAQQAANQQMTMVLQMQQQVQAMLTKINMSDPSALPQMQMLMQQQQQLMTMMQQAQQAQTAANAAAAASALHSSSANSSLSCNSPVQPHGHFDAPPLVKDHTKERAFADVQNEMVQMLMSQK